MLYKKPYLTKPADKPRTRQNRRNQHFDRNRTSDGQDDVRNGMDVNASPRKLRTRQNRRGMTFQKLRTRHLRSRIEDLTTLGQGAAKL